MAKEGSTVSGLMDSFACAVSIALQHGVPLKLLCEKFAHTRFEPSGWSGNRDIGFAKSIMDYIFRWLQLRFLTGQQQLLFENLRPKPSALSTQPSARWICRLDNEKPEARNWPRPRRRRPSRTGRPGRRPNLQLLRLDHDQKWKLLPVHELWQHQRVFVGNLEVVMGKNNCDDGLDGRCRDADGEIRRKRSDTLVGTLRREYGEHFAEDFRSDAKLEPC